MPIGILFWALFIIWLIFGGVWWRNGSTWQYGWGGNMLLVMVLLFLLGWNDFGFILQGGRGSPFVH
jgi:hypothetical protein